ncbi:MAG: hypothetical protein K0R57_6457 [Paenibacillaceae bacterium]|jgi:hypothetical protein|nr:hypothetical protein [Paenibacillaceae bacterium]
MTAKERENELKLDILASLARSQRALAGMLEDVSALTSESAEAADSLRRQLKVLVKCQIVLAEKICGIRLSQAVRGKPGKIWFHPGIVEARRREAAQRGKQGK